MSMFIYLYIYICSPNDSCYFLRVSQNLCTEKRLANVAQHHTIIPSVNPSTFNPDRSTYKLLRVWLVLMRWHTGGDCIFCGMEMDLKIQSFDKMSAMTCSCLK